MLTIFWMFRRSLSLFESWYPVLSHCKGTHFSLDMQIYNVNFCKFIIFILLFKISHFKAI